MQRAAHARIEHLEQHVRAQQREFVVQRGGGVVLRNWQRLHQEDVARIEPRVHLHDGDPGFTVSRFYGAVYGRGATPARQQRAVDVDAAHALAQTAARAAHVLKNPFGKQQAVCGHHHGVRVGLGDGLARRLRIAREFSVQPQTARLRQRQ